MKIVIDISEETYIKAKAGILGSLGEIIANGTPLKEPSCKEHTGFDDCYPCTTCQEFECDGCKYNHKGEE